MNYKLIKPDQRANTAKFTGEINVWSVKGNVKPCKLMLFLLVVCLLQRLPDRY